MKITQMLTIGWRVRFGYFASYCGHRPMPVYRTRSGAIGLL